MSVPALIFIVGPTGVGKSNIAFQLAQKINAEIISCDAIQIYKEINIISDKPPKEILTKIIHHLIDIKSIEEEFDVALYNQLAVQAIKEILAQGKIPLIVGGSGLYMEILLDGIFQDAPKDEKLRQQLRNEANEYGTSFLYERLKQLDEKVSVTIHPHDLKRIIRALEVYLTTHQSILELQKKRQGLWGEYPIVIFGLRRERQELYQRVDARVDRMFQQGLLEEIQALQDKKWTLTTQRIIGVKEIQAYFRGQYDLEQAKYLIKRNSRHFVKRQLTWFHREKRIEWLMLPSGGSLAATVDRICERIRDE